MNKVTGFSKPPQKYTPSEEVASPWLFTGKGKSLGKKPAAGTIRDK